MRAFDLTPFMHSAIGFDDLFGIADRLTRAPQAESSFPPYNIEKLGEDAYVLTMALAGFSDDDLSITLEEETLIVTGRGEEADANTTPAEYLHHGIAKRAFERRFELADSVKVRAANFEHGLLSIALEREIPEHKKPRQIEIKTGKAKKLSKAA
jgi:molecular chaperone IbpA